MTSTALGPLSALIFFDSFLDTLVSGKSIAKSELIISPKLRELAAFQLNHGLYNYLHKWDSDSNAFQFGIHTPTHGDTSTPPSYAVRSLNLLERVRLSPQHADNLIFDVFESFSYIRVYAQSYGLVLRFYQSWTRSKNLKFTIPKACYHTSVAWNGMYGLSFVQGKIIQRESNSIIIIKC